MIARICGARPFTVTCNPEVEALAKADIVTGVVEFGLEVDQIDVHLHGYLQTKEGPPVFRRPFFSKRIEFFCDELFRATALEILMRWLGLQGSLWGFFPAFFDISYLVVQA